MHISVVVPLFNEEQSIPPLCSRLVEVLRGMDTSYEIVLVDDGSSDATWRRIKECSEGAPAVKAIRLRRNFGQTAAIMAGIDHAGGDIIVTIDGDLQNDPTDIPQMIAKVNEGSDVVSGWRKNRKDPFLTRVLPSAVANWVISLISGVHLRDYGCTLKAYRRSVIEDVKLYGEMHRFIPIYASLQGAKVAEIVVRHAPRTHGRSKYGLSRTVKVLLDLLVVKFLASYSQKPIYVFGGFGLLSLGFSALTFLLMLYYKFWGGKTFVETPLPSVVVTLFLVGLMSMLMGLLAEIQMRTYYESQGKKPYLIAEAERIVPGN